MAENSKIEWTDASWNPIRARNRETGGIGHFCVHASAGCANCYAETMQPRFRNFVRYAAQDRAKVEVFLDSAALLQPLRWRRPRRIFVCSMTDLFEDGHDDDMIDQVFAVMALCPQHTFQVLTKRAARMREYFSGIDSRRFRGSDYTTAWHRFEGVRDALDGIAARMNYEVQLGQIRTLPLPNVWLGVSAEDQPTADSRIPDLLATPAALRFVSYEPALEFVDCSPWLFPFRVCPDCPCPDPERDRSDIDRCCQSPELADSLIGWMIIGGESGRKARPFDIRWARDTIAQCRAAGVSVFVKQLGAKPFEADLPYRFVYADRHQNVRHAIHHPKGGSTAEWPEDLRVREFPGEVAA